MPDLTDPNFPRSVPLSDLAWQPEQFLQTSQTLHPNHLNATSAGPSIRPLQFPAMAQSNCAALGVPRPSLTPSLPPGGRINPNYLKPHSVPPQCNILGTDIGARSVAGPSVPSPRFQKMLDDLDAALSLDQRKNGDILQDSTEGQDVSAPSGPELPDSEFLKEQQWLTSCLPPLQRNMPQNGTEVQTNALTPLPGLQNPASSNGLLYVPSPHPPTQYASPGDNPAAPRFNDVCGVLIDPVAYMNLQSPSLPQGNAHHDNAATPTTAFPSAPQPPRRVVLNGVNPVRGHALHYPPPRVASIPPFAQHPRISARVHADAAAIEELERARAHMPVVVPRFGPQARQLAARDVMVAGQRAAPRPPMEDTSPPSAGNVSSADAAVPDEEPLPLPVVEQEQSEDVHYKQPSAFWPFTREQVVAIHFCKYAIAKVGWLISDQRVGLAMQQKLKNEIRRLWAHWVLRRITRTAFTIAVARFAEECCMPVRKLNLLSSFLPYYKVNADAELDQTMDFNW